MQAAFIYIIRRGLYTLSVFAGIVLLVFMLFRGFGDPAVMLAGQSGNAETLQHIRADLRLDLPVWKQLLHYVNDLSPVCIHERKTIQQKSLRGIFWGDERAVGLKVPYLGKSYQTGRPVWDILMQALPGTLMLALAAMCIAIPMGIGLGMLGAIYRNSLFDRLSMIVSVAGISMPSFFMAVIFIWLFAIVLQNYTGLPVYGNWYEINEITGERVIAFRNWVLPAITLGIRPLAFITQLTRSSMMDVLHQDYIKTAFAKGLSARRVYWLHALPNALNPVITAVTGWFAELLAGAFFIEYIFGWQGIGSVTVRALEQMDYPVLMGAVLISALIFMLVHFFTDVLYRMIDPRIR
ncbi:MAG: ABC transporter permease [Ferruginibacter sp.]|nr:ABC transporter permease [Ferruginibacter sp.]